VKGSPPPLWIWTAAPVPDPHLRADRLPDRLSLTAIPARQGGGAPVQVFVNP
jgi:hypothetical protein